MRTIGLALLTTTLALGCSSGAPKDLANDGDGGGGGYGGRGGGGGGYGGGGGGYGGGGGGYGGGGYQTNRKVPNKLKLDSYPILGMFTYWVRTGGDIKLL